MPSRPSVIIRWSGLMRAILCLTVSCAYLLAGDIPSAERPTTGQELRVMTFNIRNGGAADGVNQWEKRRDLCAARIAHAAADLVGLQEALTFQNEFLVDRLKDFTVVGVGRNDGKAKGEFATILFRTARFALVDSGTFWLSPTPQEVGSKGWDAAFPRIATWTRLRDRQAGEREVLWINTHFDHRGKQAKLEAARQIRRFAADRAKGAATVITGDFNAEPGSAPYQALLERNDDGLTLIDTYAVTHPGVAKFQDGTSHGYRVPPVGPHIDWILASPHFAIRSLEVDRYREDDRFPSDHFPVIALMAWK